MDIILGYLVICLFASLESKKYPKVTAGIIFVVGTFICGYRSLAFTGDNIAYAQYYENNSIYTLAESWKLVITRSGKDPFYYFLGNVFSKMGFTYRGWFIFIAIVYMGGFCYVMYRYSKNYFISVLMLISLSYFYFSMTGLRQSLALGICFFAFDLAYRKKLIPFILCVGLASLFHSSALIFLLMYLVMNLSIGLKQWGVEIIAVGISFLNPSYINRLVELLAWNDDLAGYSASTTGLSTSGFVIQFLILIFCLFFLQYAMESDTNFRPFLNAMFLGLIIQTFVVNIDNLFRMSMYFSVYSIILVPEVISLQNERNKMVLYFMVTVALLLYIFNTGAFTNFTMFGGLQ